MPELPEVEHLRRSLEPWVVGGRLGSVSVRRRSVVSLVPSERRSDGRDGFAASLLAHSTIIATHRHGKQMALESSTGAVLVVQLGMTGSVTIERGRPPRGMEAKHRHVVWEFEPSDAARKAIDEGLTQPWRLAFRDPRRFGGLTAYPSMVDLNRVWMTLGPDALSIRADVLRSRFERSQRPIKSALLDQSMIAGVGNIYADESLFASKIHPLRSCGSLDTNDFQRLAASLRQILSQAVEAGGSTLRDYRDAFGDPGDAVQIHQVYGRGGQPCHRCGATLESQTIGGRTTVHCPACQR